MSATLKTPTRWLPRMWLLGCAVWISAVPSHGAGNPDVMTPETAQSWWAFQPIIAPPVPTVSVKESVVYNEIDHFLQSRWEAEGLSPAPPADARSLIRRATYDLTGLPPSPAEVAAFVNEPQRPYAQLLDRLLASPQYGERWGRHWLDVARYADTAGENTDRPLPQMWRYRNWVIDSLNQDLAYDDFIRMQLAGDLFHADAHGQEHANGIVATGYLALARRFGHDSDKDIHLMHEDVIDNLGKAFLGLSISCARCHDHKYDPVTAEDYYALYGIFASSKFSFAGCEAKGQPRDLVPMLKADESEALKAPWRERRARSEPRLKEISDQSGRARGTFLQSLQALRVMTEGTIEDGGSAALACPNVVVKKGELLHLAILMRGNHGADTTRIEWEINEVTGAGRHWSVTDLISNFTAGNPHPGSLEAPAQWCFIDWKDGPAFLAEKLESIAGNGELKAWSNGDTPSVVVNTAQDPVKVWTTLPGRSLFMHPGPQGPVGLEWVSPLDGEISITGTVTDAHPGGGDGVGFRLEHIAAVAAGPALLALASLTAEQDALVRQRDAEAGAEPMVPVAFAVAEATPVNVPLQERGDPEKPRNAVPRRWLSVFGGAPVPPGVGSGRRELAEWIVQHPLSTRVIVNRVWLGHFGHGLVRTPNDFGARGERPSHPELLEWLCAQFEKNGRSLKALHRLIMSSAAYQRSHAANPRDPENRWFTHCSSRRLSAEELRDSLLFIGGNLDTTPGKAHPFPAEASWTFTQHGPFNAVYDNQQRTVYQMVQRQRRHPLLALFDGADPNASTAERQVTTAPTQALFFLNDPFFHAQATRLANLALPLPEDPARLEKLFQHALQRAPTSHEQTWAAALLADYPGSLEEKWAACARVVMAGNEFFHLD